jgi:uncharacterized protein with PIN domain
MSSVVLHLDEQLRLFLAARHRAATVTAPCDRSSSSVHIVESVGIPRTEVGGYVVAGHDVGPGFRPRGGESISIRPIVRPQPAPSTPPRFVADVHLGALVRRLRLLGVNVTYRNDATDDELLAESATDDRVLLTKDRGLLCRRALVAGAFVRGQDVETQLADVLDRFDVPAAPFSRCLRCNGSISRVPKEAIADQLPAGTRRSYHDFAQCTTCGQVYWRGAHARRLDAAIAAALEV